MATEEVQTRVSGAPTSVHLGLLAVQLSFSGYHVFGKVVLESIHPLALASFRVMFATPLLFLIAARYGPILPSRKDLPKLALLGFLGVFANQVMFAYGLKLSTATNAAILMGSIPIFTIAVGWLLRIEAVGPRRILGISFAVAGALVLLDPRRFSLADDHFVGNLLILLNCLSYSTFLVLQRPLFSRLPWRTVLAWSFLFGGTGVVALASGELAALTPATIPATAWWGVAYILLFPTALAYSLNSWAIKRSTPSLVAIYTTLQPLATAALALMLLGERFGWRQAAGMFLILAGLWWVSSVKLPRGTQT